MKKIITKIVSALIIVAIIFPLLIIFVLSFSKNWRWANIIPKDFGLRSWKYFFDPKAKSLTALFNSFIISIVVTFFTFVITLPAAKSLAFYKFKFKKMIEALFFVPIIIPPVSIAMGLHVEFIKLNLANNFFGVILINILPCIPYAFFILKSGFVLMGEEIELQAKTLGANSLQVLLYVTIPILLPSIITASVMVFIVSFSQYFLSFCIGGGQVLTFPILMIPFIQSGDRMLGSVFSFVFIIVMFFILLVSEIFIKSIYKQKQGRKNA
ncbi:MAG: ABC transporter permease subunit [Treponemataceae bacterium]